MATAGGVRAAKAYVEIGVHSRLQQGLARAAKQLAAFGAAVRRLGSQVQAIGRRFLTMGGIAAASIAGVVKVFSDFDDRMRIVKAVTGATGKDFAALTEEAKRLGRTTSFTASQVADSMVELGRAGFKPDEILNSTEAILALSRASATDLPRAAEIAGATLRGFSMDTKEMGRASDVLTATVNGSAQTLEQFYEGMKYVAPLAVEAGASIEDVSAAMAILANNGIKGSLAGNALARAYKNLSTESRQQVLRGIGVEAVDAAGNLRPLSDILEDLGTATRGMGSAEKLALFEGLFGRGQAAALKLATAENAEAFKSIREDLLKSKGVAIRTAEEMDAGIGGAFRRMFSAIEGSAIEIGEALAEPMQQIADRFQQVANIISKVVKDNPEIVRGFLKGIGVALAAGAALIGIGVSLKAIGVAAGALAVGIKAIGIAALVAFNPLTLAIAAVGVAFYAASDSARAATTEIVENFRKLGGSLKESWGGIVAALSSGNLALAGEIAMGSLRLVWETSLASLKRLWTDWVYDLAGAFVVVEVAAKRIFGSIKIWIGEQIEGIAGLLSYVNEGWGESLRRQGAGLRVDGRRQQLQSTDETVSRRIAALEPQRDRELQAQRDRLDSLRQALSELNRTAFEGTIRADEVVIEGDVEVAAEMPAPTASRLVNPDVQQIGSVPNRGTFSAFAASRIGGRTVFEDKSLGLQQRTAEATERIRAAVELGGGVGI